ncbi:MAG: siphovirus Gp157 family protein [Peptostreptococcaceae bacterium]
MKSISLYELSTDLVDLMDVEDVEIAEEVKAQIIENIESMIEDKSGNIIAVVKNYEATINAIKEEEKRLATNRKTIESKVSKLRDYTQECLERIGKKKVETTLGTIGLRKNPVSLVIDNEELIPSIYKTSKEVISIDKNTIKDFIKKGHEVEGCRLSEEGYSLTIK